LIYTLANSLWLAGCLAESTRFRRAVKQVEQEQQGLLRHLLAVNAETEFGRAHGFSSIHSVREYQQRVPLRDFDAYQGLIDRVSAGSSNILTREPVRLFEPTSGSSGAAKLIPYTRSLQREFQRGIRSWIADLFLHYPQLLSGQAYWSVSPATMADSRTPGGVSIGFEDDAAYVGGWQQRLVNAVMTVPSTLRSVSDMKAFQYLTLLFLIRTSKLKLISVWNPTFLSLLVDHLPEWGDELVYDLEQGSVGPRKSLPNNFRSIRPEKQRAAELRAALRLSNSAERHARLWPDLLLISCWTDANAAAPAAHLKTLFPQARIQGKGLIATEGFVSFPMVGQEDSILAVRSHFLEFLPVTSGEEVDREHPQLAHQLDRGQRYAVVLTTGGGLYRYLLPDMVEVTGHFHACPLVRFLGRYGHVSDWVGEKLNEAHVSQTLQEVFSELGMSPSFAMLACDTNCSPAGYVLYVDAHGPDETLASAAAQIDIGLRNNFHYHYARKLGQLSLIRVFRAQAAAQTYLSLATGNGQRAGGVKPPALDLRDGWSGIFKGHFLSGRSSN